MKINLGIDSFADESNFESGGKWEATKENFPCVAHFYPLNEPDSEFVGPWTYTLHDVIGGKHLDAEETPLMFSQALTTNGINSARITATTSEQSVPFEWDNPQNKDIVPFVIGNGTLFINFGHAFAATDRGVQISKSMARIRLNDGTTQAQSAGTPVVTPSGECSISYGVFKHGVSVQYHEIEEDGTQHDGVIETTNAPSLDMSTGYEQQVFVGATAGSVDGFGIMYFENGVPDDLHVGMAWMLAEVRAGRKLRIYPAWAGRT